jgi:hypothetical protein
MPAATHCRARPAQHRLLAPESMQRPPPPIAVARSGKPPTSSSCPHAIGDIEREAPLERTREREGPGAASPDRRCLAPLGGASATTSLRHPTSASRGESERQRRRDGKEERKRKEKRNGPGKIMENRK